MNDEEKLQYLLGAGGIHCAGEEYVIEPLFANLKEFDAFLRLPKAEQDAVLANIRAEYVPAEDAVSLYGAENLVKVQMPDESMVPLIYPGDELTVAFREEPEDGDLAAVRIPGSEEPFVIREVGYSEFDLWLIPQNQDYAAECCDPERAVILGKIVE